jgi:hypothetical protein
MIDPRSAAIYSATVKAIGDVEKRFGWLKVVLGNKEIMSHAIWAQPAFSSHHFMMPKIDDRVLIFFESGSWNDVYWFGQRSDETVAPQEAIDGYPTSQVIKSISGHVVELNDKAGSEAIKIKSAPKNGKTHVISLNSASEEIVIAHASQKAKITIRQDGSIELISNAVTGNTKDVTLNTGNVKWTMGQRTEFVDVNQNRIQINDAAIRITDKKGNVINIGNVLTVTDKAGSQIKMEGGNITINAKGNLILNNGSNGVVRANDRATPHTHTVVAPPGGGPCTVSPAIISFPSRNVSRRTKAG